MLTRQSVFDTVAEKLIEQGAQSIAPMSARCRYRQQARDTVLKCAVGHLIPDEVYQPGMEDYSAGRLTDFHAAELPELSAFAKDQNKDFLIALQQAHDTTSLNFDSEDFPGGRCIISGEPINTDSWIAEWAHDMRRIAAHFDLDASKVEGL